MKFSPQARTDLNYTKNLDLDNFSSQAKMVLAVGKLLVEAQMQSLMLTLFETGRRTVVRDIEYIIQSCSMPDISWQSSSRRG